jgi:hypothetical protein
MVQRLFPAAALGLLLLVPATSQAQFRSFRSGFLGDPLWFSPWYRYGYYPGYQRYPYRGTQVNVYPQPSQPTYRPRDNGKTVEQKQRIQEFYPSGKSVSPEVGPPAAEKDAPASIDAICLKAMARQSEDRYPTALALAADLETWLADEPVTAYREPLPQRARRWARRHKPQVSAAATVLLAVLVLGGAGGLWLEHLWADRRAEQAQNAARAQEAVETALVKARELREQERWTEAEAVLVQAASRLGEDGFDDLKEQLQQAHDELDLVKQLDDIRLKPSLWVKGHFDYATAAREYPKAFEKAGLAVHQKDPSAVAIRIRESAIRDQIVAALDDWAYGFVG